MTQVVTLERKQVAVRVFKMLVICIMMHTGLSIIGFFRIRTFSAAASQEREERIHHRLGVKL